MGTSKSSDGSPSGVPMVPPWVPDLDTTDDDSTVDVPGGEDGDGQPALPDQPQIPVPIAPSRRFGPTRTALGKYASSGDRDSMRRGVRHYVGGGLGGSRTATRRFARTASTAGSLYGALGGGAGAATDQHPLDIALLAGKSARKIIAAIVEAVRPVDGTQDAEASRNSINDALSELVQRHPDADLLSLSEEQREYVIERFVSMDVYRRFVLDVGKAITKNAPTASTTVSRLREVREYIRETVFSSFRKLRESGKRLSGSRVSQLVRTALKAAFDVFAGYME